MSNYSNLKNGIQEVIKTNENNEITGYILQTELISMIDTLGAGYQMMGVAQPSTNPGTPDARVAYLAYSPGTYVNFGNINVTGLCLLKYATTWTKEDIPVSGGGSYVLPIASANVLGGIKIGNGLTIDENGVVSVNGGGGTYVLPIASANVLGGVKIGSGLSIDSNGVLSVNSGGGGTVTRVALTVPTASGFSVSGSPITGAGTIAISLDSQTKGKFLASPASSSGVPTFRAIAASDIPDLSGKYVTLDTDQNNISGEKTFTTKPVHIGQTSGLDVNEYSYIDIGEVRLVYDRNNKALHVTTKSGNETIGFYADGFVSAKGAAATGDQIKFVTLTGAQNVDGVKTFLANLIANGTVTINGVTLTGSSSALSVNKNASFAGIVDTGYSSGHVVSIQDIVNRLVALENA